MTGHAIADPRLRLAPLVTRSRNCDRLASH